MCEIMIRTVDSTHADPETDECHCWKTNDVVQALPDGTPWGPRETGEIGGRLAIIFAPGLDPDAVKDWIGPKLDTTVDPPKTLRKSRCFYDSATNRLVDKDDPNDFIQL